MADLLPARPAHADATPGRQDGKGTPAAAHPAGPVPPHRGTRPRTRSRYHQGNDSPDRNQQKYAERAFPEVAGDWDAGKEWSGAGCLVQGQVV